jgi:hypothetical protein
MFPRPGSLSMELRRAQHLARMDDFFDYTRGDCHPSTLPLQIKTWVYEMFCMGPHRRYNDDIGTIADLVRRQYPELFFDLDNLSKKLENIVYRNCYEYIDNRDWDLMINGVEWYRRYLLDQHSCGCCMDW